MLYKNEDLFCPEVKFKKDNLIILDLSILEEQVFIQRFNSIAANLQLDCNRLRYRFEDTLISTVDINEKANIIVFSIKTFDREFHPVDQKNIYIDACSPYDFLIKTYENYITIGVKINLNQLQQFEEFKAKKEKIFKKIRIYSIVLREQQFQLVLPKLRKFVKQLWNEKAKIQFILDIKLKNIASLKIIKQELIENQYPIEYFAFQTNILNLIQNKSSGKIEQNYQQIAFKYTEALKKYIPIAVSTVIDYYEASNIPLQKYEENVDGVLRAFNKINYQTQRKIRQYKKWYRTGITFPGNLLMKISEQFTMDEYDHSRVKCLLDSIGFNKIYQSLIGKYQKPIAYE